MQHRASVTIAIVTLMLSLPLAAADWMGRGFYEPDTSRDKSDGFMHLAPDTEANPNVRKVYFSVYTTMYPTPLNPNVGAARSAMMQYPTDIHAILGVWKDCNRDGYIGLAEGVLADYSSVLLPSGSPCAAVAVDPSAPDFVPVHNDGTWVRELLVIGPDHFGDGETPSPDNNTFPWNIADEAARVWADWDLPESSATTTCLALPGSRGNLQSTGGFLRWADCLLSWRITGTANEAANLTGLQQIGFNDAPKERPDQSASLLNQQNPYGQPSAAPLVSVYDCEADPAVEVTDPTGGELPQSIEDPTGVVFDGSIGLADEEGRYAYFYAMRAPPSVNPGGSVAGSVNETLEGSAGDCDRSAGTGTNSELVYFFEGDQEANPIAKKVQTSAWFNYFEPTPTTCNPSEANADPSQLDTGCGGVLNSGSACVETTTCTPLMLGAWPNTGPYGAITGVPVFNQWYGLPGTVASRNPFVSRESLTAWGGVYVTAYAYVSPSLALALPAAPAIYGSPHCDGVVPTTGVFECDPAKWYLGPDGNDIAQDFQVRVGHAYNLRDIDCYDHSASSGAPANLGLIGSTVCAR